MGEGALMLLQSAHSLAERGCELYESPDVAVAALLRLERLPPVIWEPAAGRGAIVRPLRAAGHTVIATDLHDHGAGFDCRVDYLTAPIPDGVQGVVTNPPYTLAERFIRKAIAEVPYSAWLLRTNFLESVGRLSLFRDHPPARVWVSSRRLPMMHRDGWAGPTASSNTCHAWFIFERGSNVSEVRWFDWKDCAHGYG
jgi:hypothetical protein